MELNADDVLAAMGYRPGVRPVDVVFHNPSIDTATVPETVSPIGGLVALRTAAAVVELVSTSAADAAAGTGARSVLVQGLDAQYNEVSEVLVPNGITPVQGAVLFLRINTVSVLSAGTGGTNAGDITIRDAGAGTTRSFILAAQGISEVGVYTVPAEHQLLATGWTISARDAVGNKALADVAFYVREQGVRKIDWRMSLDGTISPIVGTAHVFHEKADIEVVVTRVNTNGTTVYLHGHGLLIGPNNGM